MSGRSLFSTSSFSKWTKKSYISLGLQWRTAEEFKKGYIENSFNVPYFLKGKSSFFKKKLSSKFHSTYGWFCWYELTTWEFHYLDNKIRNGEKPRLCGAGIVRMQQGRPDCGGNWPFRFGFLRNQLYVPNTPTLLWEDQWLLLRNADLVSIVSQCLLCVQGCKDGVISLQATAELLRAVSYCMLFFF